MRNELIAQLDAWHEEDEYQQIVDRIKEVPTPLIDDELAMHLGRALNNLERYKEALKWFLKFKESHKKDALWYFRVGYAYYYLDQLENAIKALERAHKLDPEDEDTLTMLEWSRKELAAAPSEESSEEESEL